MADANNWSTIESDPGVFTELCERIGAGGVQVEELWALDADALRALAPVYGVVFLFKWMRSVSSDGARASDEQAAGVYFVKQLVNNACATQALIAILLVRFAARRSRCATSAVCAESSRHCAGRDAERAQELYGRLSARHARPCALEQRRVAPVRRLRAKRLLCPFP